MYVFFIGDGNSKHYLVASQDIDIQQRLREIPGVCVGVGGDCVHVHTYLHIFVFFYSGVPLIHIVRNTLVLESPSEMSHSEADKVIIHTYVRTYVCNIRSFAFCMFRRVLLWLYKLSIFHLT